MPDTDIASTVVTDLTNSIEEFSFDSESTDAGDGSHEFRWQNDNWKTDYGYYQSVPEFKRAIDTKALWTVGAGFESDEVTTMLLDTIKGNGKESFNSILKNMIKIKTISMDSFAEIIRDDKGVLINLKVLDPSSIVIVQDDKGMIKRYEQVDKHKKPFHKFDPSEIFHLSHERVADEIHGTRIIKSLQWLIIARNEAMNDWKVVLKRNVKPMRIWYVDSDDTAKVAAFKAKVDNANADTENLVVPKGTVETEIATVAPNQVLNPLPWIDKLNDYFFQAVNVPQIIVGQGKEFTDASGKIVYLSYEQNVKEEQLYIEEQVLGQLNLEINLTFPATMQNEMITSRDKDSEMTASQPNDTTIEMEGRT